MAKQSIGLGTVADDGTGDTLRSAGDKINDNFDELYTSLGDGSTLTSVAVTAINNATANELVTIGATTTELDAEANLTFDGSTLSFANSGTNYLTISNSSNDAVITSGVQDKDILFKGDDGGSAITALTLDISDSGTAIFNNDVVVGNDLELTSDSSVIVFGTNSDVKLTHVHNTGLTLTHAGTTDNLPVVFQLKSEEDAIIADEVIASLEFAAGDSDGTDGATVAAGIHAIAEGTFSASANATKLVFTTGVSETAAASATAKMTLSSAGLLTIADDFVIKDGGTIGVASDADSMTIASTGIVTFSQIPALPVNSIEISTTTRGAFLVMEAGGTDGAGANAGDNIIDETDSDDIIHESATDLVGSVFNIIDSAGMVVRTINSV